MPGKELIGASTIPIILTILYYEENYGYQLIKKVKEISNGNITWSDAMLYPVLGRMERDGLIQSRWEVIENDRRRKYYRITTIGKQLLQEKKEDWIQIVTMLSHLWNFKFST